MRRGASHSRPAAEAQQQHQTIIRDTEIEALLRDYAKPIFAAAGFGSRDAEIVIVHDNDFNAFVASGHRMVIYTGTLLQAKTPNEVIGVIAHETGHLAGGHLEKLHNEIARAQAIGGVVGLLGVAGMAAGAAAGSSTTARMGSAAMTMGSTVAVRTLLSYRRDAGIRRRPRRPHLPQRHAPVGERHGDDVPALRRPAAPFRALRRPLRADAPDGARPPRPA